METGARYLLDPRRKHHPTLVSDDQEVRVDFLVRAKRIAADLGADCVSFWSGIGSPDSWEHLKSGVAAVLDGRAGRAARAGAGAGHGGGAAGPGAAAAGRSSGNPDSLGITLDVGHCVAVEWQDAAACLRQAGALLMNVQLDDMLPGVHEHLEFGEGQLDLPDTLGALTDIGYTGVAAVELPRHSHAAPVVARRAFDALRTAGWLAGAEQALRADPTSIETLFPVVGRAARDRADEARVRLLVAYADATQDVGRRAHRALPARHVGRTPRRAARRSPRSAAWRRAGVELVKDALRSNETGLVAAALGAFAAATSTSTRGGTAC